MSSEQIKTLSLGLNFCLDAQIDVFETIKDLQLFARNLLFKILHSAHDSAQFSATPNQGSIPDLQMVRLLNDLLDENNFFEDDEEGERLVRESEET